MTLTLMQRSDRLEFHGLTQRRDDDQFLELTTYSHNLYFQNNESMNECNLLYPRVAGKRQSL